MTQEDFSAVCPYLGLADDADSHATYATEAHRCYRLPNPTRIASPHQESYCLGANHVTCPVYLGEGVPKTVPAAAAGAGAAGAFTTGAPSRPVEESETVRGPQGSQRPPSRRPFEPGPGGAPGGTVRGAKRQSPNALGPRPRTGGVSMPVATIGLFALAVIVIALAFAINNLVGGGGDDSNLSSADVVATRAAEKASQTAKAGGAPTNAPAQTQTPGGAATATLAPGQTRTTTATAGSATPGGAAAKTVTVKAGDTCGAIASANNITLQQLLTANNKTEDDCTRLQVGDVLKLP